MNHAHWERIFDVALWLSAAGHFLTLAASFQVPYRLEWKRDLAQLMPFNRKLMWVQSGFTAMSIFAFGVLTLLLHREMLRGDRAALALVCYIAVFWTARIFVDALYYSHEDWPKGRQFVIGHILLTCMFVAQAASYWGLLAWHVLLGGNG